MAEDNRTYRTESNRLARQYPKKKTFGDDVLILSNQSGRFQLTYYQGRWFNGDLLFTVRTRTNWSSEQEQRVNDVFNTWGDEDA